MTTEEKIAQNNGFILGISSKGVIKITNGSTGGDITIADKSILIDLPTFPWSFPDLDITIDEKGNPLFFDLGNYILEYDGTQWTNKDLNRIYSGSSALSKELITSLDNRTIHVASHPTSVLSYYIE